MDPNENLTPTTIDLFSPEGQRFLKEIVSVVDIRNYARLDAGLAFAALTAESAEVQSDDVPNDDTGSRYGCTLCDFQCSTVNEQREHFQSEWHLFNLRRRLKSKSLINQKTYEQIIEGAEDVDKDDSSTTSSSSEDDQELDEKRAKLDNATIGARGGAVFFLTKDNRVVSCYRSLLTPVRSYQVENYALATSLRHLRTETNIWIILILSGGHFAAAVFDNTTLKNNEAVVHKTIHRYTVRAKQGGSQQAKDAQAGKAKSAGATLRRYNEEALVKDIHNLLTNWNDHVRRASAIFLRCAIYKRPIFFGGLEPLFSKTDQRIRNIPFVTRRPTYEETKRVRNELATLDVYDSYESFLNLYRRDAATNTKSDVEAEIKNMAKLRLDDRSSKTSSRRDGKKTSPSRESKNDAPKKMSKKQQEPQRTLEYALAQDLRQRLYTACKRGDSNAVRQIVEERPADVESIRDYLNSPITDKEGSTFLHQASASGHLELLQFLLDFGCDPARKNTDNRVPFQVANGKPTRTIFVQFRENHPTRWDWNMAQIPEPVVVDPEVEASRKAKMAEKKKAVAKAKAERMKEKKEVDAKARAEEAEKRRFLQLSDREKRALAAEKRWQTQILGQGKEEEAEAETAASAVLSRCFRCGIDITGKVPFEYSDNRFCTVKCVKEHRLTNDAN